jgi:predicted nuclease of predicted toxin-antitoxin system
VNFLADECCDALLVDGLRCDGRDVGCVKEMAALNDDETVLQMAVQEQRILLTEDKNFGELVVRLKLPAYGIVLLRMNPADSAAKLARMRHLLLHHSQRLAGSFVILGTNKSRFRAL